MSNIDLHVHTTASDGTVMPRDVVQEAAALGLCAIAITDHDTVQGVNEAMEKGKQLGVEVIAGVELSVLYEKEMHILGYYIDVSCSLLQQTLEQLKIYRQIRNPQMIQKLNDLGLNITMEEVEQEANGDIIGRPHIANVLIRKGYVRTENEAFMAYLAEGKPAYVEKERLSPQKAIEVIHAAGGIAVLAHPKYLVLSNVRFQVLLTELMNLGLDGLEVYYGGHSWDEIRKYEILARRKGLLMTGGSDFHGTNKPEILLGKGMNQARIPKEILDHLKKGILVDKSESFD